MARQARLIVVWSLLGMAVCAESALEHFATQGKPVALTKYGPVIGTHRKSSLGSNVSSFWRIPYAHPPLGSLRFRPPKPPSHWSEPLDLSAEPAPSHACLQATAAVGEPSPGTEDCLILHAYTPRLPTESKKPLPVMLWIHGGGFTLGDAWQEGLYDGQELAARFNVVVFVAQYRLGVMGFLALDQLQEEDPDHSTGNYGVMDQRAAMMWARDNAAAFGGDPEKVTIFGESAGGESICYHLSSPASHGLFHAAIMESGACDLQFDTVAERQFSFQAYNNLTNCTWGSKDYVDCLRTLDGSFLQGLPANPRSLQRSFHLVGPTIDGTHVGLPGVPGDLLRAGKFNNVPVIMGVNQFEYQYMCDGPAEVLPCAFMTEFDNRTGTPKLPTDAAWRSGMEVALEHNFSEAMWSEVLAMYPIEDYGGNGGARFSAMATDAGFAGRAGQFSHSMHIGECGTSRAAQDIARAGGSVWMYRMERLGSLGFVQHGSEITYVFGSRFDLTRDEDHVVSNLIGEFWTNLAKFGDPNGGSAIGQRTSHWPMLKASAPVLAHFSGVKPYFAPPTRTKFCKFWQNLLGGAPEDDAVIV